MRKALMTGMAVATIAAAASAQQSAGVTCAPVAAQDPDLADPGESWIASDLGGLEADALVGALVRSCEGEAIAIVEDVITTPEGEFDGVAVRLEGGESAASDLLFLDIDEVEVGRTGADDPALRTSYTRDELRRRPEYVAPEG